MRGFHVALRKADAQNTTTPNRTNLEILIHLQPPKRVGASPCVFKCDCPAEKAFSLELIRFEQNSVLIS